MSRAKAIELLEGEETALPPVATGLTWWTILVGIGAEADELLSAMTELRDERWVLHSATPIEADLVQGRRMVHLACIFRRLSAGEDNVLRMQQPMTVDWTPRGRTG